MPLYIKDPEVDRMAERLASQRRLTKTEVVKQALRRDLERTEGQADMVEQVAALVRDLKSRAGPGATGKVDKAFIDSLYE
jgi:antitoxin VapB